MITFEIKGTTLEQRTALRRRWKVEKLDDDYCNLYVEDEDVDAADCEMERLGIRDEQWRLV